MFHNYNMGPNSPIHGLTEAEVRRLRETGGGNAPPPPITKPTGQIVREHVCTLFNLFNVLIALALAAVGAWSNLLFILIIALNTAIGIAQELHAKRLVERIAVLTVPKARALRDGETRTLPVEELVLGDVIVLERGAQVPADALVLEGGVETDESLLTGESTPVGKGPGDELLSGSAVVSGACVARVVRVGADNYAARLTQEAKAAAPDHSELMTSMGKVTRFTAFLIPPLGALLFVQAYLWRGAPLFDAVTATAAGLLGMLPKGLVLLITVSLAVGVAKLAKSRVLVQNLFSLESLAHVDVLCLDKTGTLTQGKMRVERVVPLDSRPPRPLEGLMGAFLANSGDNNATFQALRDYFGAEDGGWKPLSKVPFSSQRKWSAVTFPELGTVVVGAPERMTGAALPEELRTEIQAGRRVLYAALTSQPVRPDGPLPETRALAARQAAQVVLLDSDFTALPSILLEGRRVVNNMTRVAGVFFVKTIYSALLSLLCVLTNLPFPLIPIQVTLIDLFIEAYPAFFQSFVPDGRKLTARFLPSVLRRTLPNAIAILLSSAVLLLGGGALGLPAGQLPLALYLVIGAVEAEALLKSCLPMTPLRGFLFVTASAGFFCAAVLFHAVLSLPPLLPETVPAVLLLSALSILAERLCAWGLRHLPRLGDGEAEYLKFPCA